MGGLSNNALVAGTSIGDGDGGDGTSWMPIDMLNQRFIIPTATQHVTIGCMEPAQVSYYNTAGTLTTVSLTGSGANDQYTKYKWSTAATAGFTLNASSASCLVVADIPSDHDE